MQLKYHEDINWQDLSKIERPFFARFTIENELSKPWPRLQKGFSFRDPLSEIYQRGRREIDPNAFKRLLRQVEEGSVLLVHTFEGDTPYPAFIWKKDESHPDKGHWTLSEHIYSVSEYRFNLLLNTVKKPQQRGSIKASTVPSSEYGYISSSTQSTSIAETTVADVATTIGKYLYKIGSKTVVLATLKPINAGGTTTYEIPNEPDIRIIESDLEPARYQRRVDGEWQTTGVQAIPVIEDGRLGEGFEALSPDDMDSLKSTGGISIAPQAKPTIESYPPDNPPDSSPPAFPDNRGHLDNSTASFPAEGPGPMARPGYGDTDAGNVVGSSVMYNENKVDINPGKTIGGRKIINSDLAGTIVKTKGGNVRIDSDGFPDFTPYSQKTVRIDGLTGDMENDVPLAMEKAGLKSYDKKTAVWHHHQDGETMMLVPRDVHSVRNGGVAHTGGRAVIVHNLNNPTNQLNYPSPPEKY